MYPLPAIGVGHFQMVSKIKDSHPNLSNFTWHKTKFNLGQFHWGTYPKMWTQKLYEDHHSHHMWCHNF